MMDEKPPYSSEWGAACLFLGVAYGVSLRKIGCGEAELMHALFGFRLALYCF